jgi:chromosome segregation ATPase
MQRNKKTQQQLDQLTEAQTHNNHIIKTSLEQHSQAIEELTAITRTQQDTIQVMLGTINELELRLDELSDRSDSLKYRVDTATAPAPHFEPDNAWQWQSVADVITSNSSWTAQPADMPVDHVGTHEFGCDDCDEFNAAFEAQPSDMPEGTQDDYLTTAAADALYWKTRCAILQSNLDHANEQWDESIEEADNLRDENKRLRENLTLEDDERRFLLRAMAEGPKFLYDELLDARALCDHLRDKLSKQKAECCCLRREYPDIKGHTTYPCHNCSVHSTPDGDQS